MRTLSVKTIDAAGTQDLDNTVVDGIDSLAQRIEQRLRFLLGTWQLDTRKGTPSVLGREFTPELAGTVISGAVRDEGGSEINEITDVRTSLDRATRTMRYTVTAKTIYGSMTVSGTVV